VFQELRKVGETCGKHRVAWIMGNRKIKAQRGYKAPRAIAGRPSIIALNRLQRVFKVEQPDTVWLIDITSSGPGRAGYTRESLTICTRAWSLAGQ